MRGDLAHEERGVGGGSWEDEVSVGGIFSAEEGGGNYRILADGKDDPAFVGGDGIKGTAPVGSFRANALGWGATYGSGCWMGAM